MPNPTKLIQGGSPQPRLSVRCSQLYQYNCLSLPALSYTARASTLTNIIHKLAFNLHTSDTPPTVSIMAASLSGRRGRGGGWGVVNVWSVKPSINITIYSYSCYGSQDNNYIFYTSRVQTYQT